MRNIIVTVVTTFVILFAVGGLTFATLPACPTEDSDNCKWNAQTRGNGMGRSFVTVAGITITY